MTHFTEECFVYNLHLKQMKFGLCVKPHVSKKTTQMWRRWGTTQNFLLMNFEKHRKWEFWKNEKKKKIAGDTMILLMCTKIHKHMRYSSWDMEWDKICHFRPFFAILPHYWPQKLNFGKNVKNTWRYYPFTHVYHKSRSYDVWFLRYKV